MRTSNIESLFNPKSVAVIGVSGESYTKSDRFGRGAGLIGILRKVGFPGRIYPIHPNIDEVMGLKAYRSLKSIKDSIDLAVISVSNRQVLTALEQCIDAGIKNVHVFTAGFGETGEKEGVELQETIEDAAKKRGINLIGPNCVGLHLPYVKFSTVSTFLDEPGGVAFLSQSGGHTINFVGNAHFCGIGLSKVISYGNAAILDSADFLEYLGKDPETSIIAMYVEGIKDGRGFFRTVKYVNRVKPIIIWKGGLTEGGARAAASHTGSLAGRKEIWQAFFRQTGVMTVDSMQELLDIIRTFLYLKPSQGKRLGLVISGGGQSVAAADSVVRECLELPTFSRERQETVYRVISRINTSAKNPVDIVIGAFDLRMYEQFIGLIVKDPSVDFLLIDPQLEFVRDSNQRHLDRIVDLFCHFADYKPLGVILDTWEGNLATLERVHHIQKRLAQSGIVTYRNLSRACRAISRFINYHSWLQDMKVNRS